MSNKKYTPVKIVSLFSLVFLFFFKFGFLFKIILVLLGFRAPNIQKKGEKKGSQSDFTAVELRQRSSPRASHCTDETMTADVEKEQGFVFVFTVLSDIDKYLCLLLRLCLFSGFGRRFNFLSVKFCYFLKFWTPVVQGVVVQFGMCSSRPERADGACW